MTVAATLVTLIALGIAPATRLGGPWVRRLPMAVILGTGIASMIALLRLALPIPALPLVVVALVAGFADLWRSNGMRAVPSDPAGWIPLVASLPGLIPIAGTLRIRAGEYDAVYIWQALSRWYEEGGAAARAAFGQVSTLTVHADYPPLAPGATGTFWNLFSTNDDRVAQIIITAATVAAAMLAASELTRLFVRRLPTWAAIAGGSLAPLVVIGWRTENFVVGAFNGYVDLLWAALLIAGLALAIAAIESPDDRAEAGMPLLSAALVLGAAAITKTEGTMVVAPTMVTLLVVTRRDGPTWSMLAAGLGPAVAWTAISRMLGAESDLIGSGHIGDLLRGSEERLDRLQPTVEGLLSHTASITMVLLPLLVIGAIATRRSPPRHRQALLLAAVPGLAAAGGSVFAFLISDLEIGFHIATAAERVVAAPTAVLALLVALTVANVWPEADTEPNAGTEPRA